MYIKSFRSILSKQQRDDWNVSDKFSKLESEFILKRKIIDEIEVEAKTLPSLSERAKRLEKRFSKFQQEVKRRRQELHFEKLQDWTFLEPGNFNSLFDLSLIRTMIMIYVWSDLTESPPTYTADL